jgi:6-pyruvoyltetrahydropterin/6-carboxytetrahydropterin synthase
MYRVCKRLEISGAHRLELPYPSKCSNLHGHNWLVTIFCKSKTLDKDGMVIDFTHIKKIIMEKLDHAYINDVVDFNPTAENMAKWICDQVPFCHKVVIQESEGNLAQYDNDEED